MWRRSWAAMIILVLTFLTLPAGAAPNPEPSGEDPKNSQKSPPSLSCDRIGTRGPDVLAAREGRVICSLGGNDRISAKYGSVVYAGAGNDKVISHGGIVAYGQRGDDRFCVRNNLPDLAYGGTGSDRVHARP